MFNVRSVTDFNGEIREIILFKTHNFAFSLQSETQKIKIQNF